jgi:hypothetical protein
LEQGSEANDSEEMNVEEKEAIRNTLLKMAFGDVLRSLRFDEPADQFTPKTGLHPQAAILSAVIMGCCIVETAGRFRSGLSDGEAFADFMTHCVNADLKESKKYSKQLYGSLRCGLVHSLTPKKTQDMGGQAIRKPCYFDLISTTRSKHLKFVRQKDQIREEDAPTGSSHAIVMMATSGYVPAEVVTGNVTLSLPAVQTRRYLHVQTFIFDIYRGLKFLLDTELENSAAVKQHFKATSKQIGFLQVTRHSAK